MRLGPSVSHHHHHQEQKRVCTTGISSSHDDFQQEPRKDHRRRMVGSSRRRRPETLVCFGLILFLVGVSWVPNALVQAPFTSGLTKTATATDVSNSNGLVFQQELQGVIDQSSLFFWSTFDFSVDAAWQAAVQVGKDNNNPLDEFWLLLRQQQKEQQTPHYHNNNNNDPHDNNNQSCWNPHDTAVTACVSASSSQQSSWQQQQQQAQPPRPVLLNVEDFLDTIGESVQGIVHNLKKAVDTVQQQQQQLNNNTRRRRRKQPEQEVATEENHFSWTFEQTSQSHLSENHQRDNQAWSSLLLQNIPILRGGGLFREAGATTVDAAAASTTTAAAASTTTAEHHSGLKTSSQPKHSNNKKKKTNTKNNTNSPYVFSLYQKGDGSDRDPDGIPTRYLEMHKGNRELAQKSLEATLQWREEHDIDSILLEPHVKFDQAKAVCPHYFLGRDDKGDIIFLQRPALMDFPRAQQMGLKNEELLRHYVYVNEYLWQILEGHKPVGTMTSILDLTGLQISILRKRELLSFLKQFVQTMDSHYPQRAHKTLIVNAPKWVNALYKLCAPLMRESTKAKIEIHSVGPKQDAALKQYLPVSTLEQLPASFWSYNNNNSRKNSSSPEEGDDSTTTEEETDDEAESAAEKGGGRKNKKEQAKKLRRGSNQQKDDTTGEAPVEFQSELEDQLREFVVARIQNANKKMLPVTA